MKNFSVLFQIIFVISLIIVSSCKKGKENPQEVITTVVVHLTGAGGFDQEFTWEDKESDGSPVIDTIELPGGGTYTGQIHFYDRSGTNNDDITAEVAAESDLHLVIYKVAGTNATININDTDANGKPIGLETTWTTGASSAGSLQILLKHSPDKDAADPSTTGETDVDVNFPVTIL
jgi:hypothetical protein